MLDPKWDQPPRPPVETPPLEQQTAILEGTIRLAETGDVLQGASVAVIVAPNDQRGPILTDANGQYRFENLPVGEVSVVAFGPRLGPPSAKSGDPTGQTVRLDLELSPANQGENQTIIVKNLQVTIAEEATFLVAGWTSR